MDTLVLNGREYPFTALDDPATQVSLSAYEQHVAHFIRQWRAGQEVFVLNTSGSTGQPKAIRLTRQQMTLSAQLTGRAVGLQAGDRALVCLSVEYIAGLMMVVRGLELGLHLTIVDPSSRPLAACPAATHFDFTAMVPLQLQESLLGAPHEVAILQRMKAILIGGAPVSLALEQQLQALLAPAYHTYGMTETVSHIALRRLNGSHHSPDFIPFEGVQLGIDARGCLTITSALSGGTTLQTNDLVALHADGSFRWLGRIDNVINSGGYKVQTEKVESALEAWLLDYQQGRYAQRRFFVGPLQHPRFGQAVVAIIEGAVFAQDTMAETEIDGIVRAALQKTLHPYEVPRQVYFIPKFLETPTGKIDRRANLGHILTQLSC